MFCAYAMPRYQVRVYRTIGPLLFSVGETIFQSLLAFYFLSRHLNTGIHA